MSFGYHLDPSTGAKATMGLIVLQVDETVEGDARRCLPLDVALHVSRVPSGEDLTADSIARMEKDLPAAARLLPKAPHYDVVGYACTSGTTLIGADRVAKIIRQGCDTNAVTDPLTAAIAALQALNARKIGLVSPYIEDVAAPVAFALEEAGISVPRSVSFGEQVEANVVRISARSIEKAALEVGGDVDAVFLSCTNLRTLQSIPKLEVALGCPVISSNTALLWHMSALAGVGGDFSQKNRGPAFLTFGEGTQFE